MYLKRKPYNMLFERSFDTGRISIMKGSKKVLVKVVLFQLRGRGHPQDDATPNFFADSKRSTVACRKTGLFGKLLCKLGHFERAKSTLKMLLASFVFV